MTKHRWKVRTWPAFTFIEVLVSLLVTAALLTALVGLEQALKSRPAILQEEDLQAACQQIEAQHYRLLAEGVHELKLEKQGQKGKRRLRLQGDQLVIDGRHNGRMVLLKGLSSLDFVSQESYQEVKVTNQKGDVLRAILLLSKESGDNQ
ncbi:hypothetical protein [Fructobacillus papyrifericola]|uniref:Competence protein ComGF n=1 Tax=Fructobacillus papyrifericola TaxID=2713172 RepID=A0ABS5QUN8_9LACO|nr:hypothetical protein [Fructobacillus papyrifericola]MBS9335652.1 hypothetical protein [Fructobacillus papyrifericola]